MHRTCRILHVRVAIRIAGDDEAAQKKNRMFVCVLKGMVINRIDVDIGDYDTVEWTELIDRGGLTHVKTEVGYKCK